jgi:hypothetical protein
MDYKQKNSSKWVFPGSKKNYRCQNSENKFSDQFMGVEHE